MNLHRLRRMQRRSQRGMTLVELMVGLAVLRGNWTALVILAGTNDVAGHFAGIDVRDTRFKAYVLAGLIAGLVAVVTTAQTRPATGIAVPNAASRMNVPAPAPAATA